MTWEDCPHCGGTGSVYVGEEPVPMVSTIRLFFDGGTRHSNPGDGYGSYQIQEMSGPKCWHHDIVALEFGRCTNNEAELRTLITALERILVAADGDDLIPPANTIAVECWGDSQLVVNGILGTWDITSPGLTPLFAQAKSLLSRFGSHSMHWHPRKESVRILGH